MTKRELAIQAIKRVHQNKTGSLEDTLHDLESIREELDLLIEAVEADLESWPATDTKSALLNRG